MRSRRCSRTSCSGQAVATMTYVYADSTAVLGPLALRAEPGAYDLCSRHAQGLSVPLGWEVIRLAVEEQPAHSVDDLLALADAVREVGLAAEAVAPTAPSAPPSEVVELARRRHLTVLADPDR
ncbi:DUF3499 domain-containing protein [Auraticoccus monumenti]|uniref:DUF3499 domain-containing protein n=1 Tax=Auraticoccus monumenti TaxID=675864 RepID=A0A1G6Z4D3_9ACTN|nr:DUF3499 domain-containing protein [Auraticoccus monumenti]SDD97391.1 Protein of unknown function [Auraticoccus monumenti]